MYVPRPIDTSAVALPKEILNLSEKIAEHIHDNWSVQRMRDGWVYGPERDDKNKRHPCLVPYADLHESEKEYDRLTALESLRVVCALGYEIVRK